MSGDCLVSILCTAYNHEEYIADALESFLAQQTDFPFEILVTDDVSSDRTADVIRDYAARYPDIIRPYYQEKNLYQQNIDAYHAFLYRDARGKYVALCEGDDYWTDPTKLQRQVDFMEAHPEYSACVHNSMIHYCAGDRPDEPLLSRDGDGDVRLEDVIPGMSTAYHTSSLLAKKELIEKPTEFYWVGWDYGFTDQPDALGLMLHGPIRYLDRFMSVYRVGSNAGAWSAGVSGNYAKHRHFITGKIKVLECYKKYAPAECLPVLEKILLRRRFELLYVEGRDREQRQPPYDALLRAMPLKYRAVNLLKCCFPALQRLYRRSRGYTE